MIKNLRHGLSQHELQLRAAPLDVAQIAENDSSRLLLVLGHALFEFEAFRRSHRSSRLRILVPRSFMGTPKTADLVSELERLISFVTLNDIRVEFAEETEPLQLAADCSNTRTDAVALFSGGVDSTSGALMAATAVDALSAIFVSHLHQGRVIGITRRLSETYLRRLGVSFMEVPAPSMATGGYSQTRGWMYVLTAAAAAAWLGGHRVIVSECGPTMYQPKFAPADQTTMTTHPFVMERAQAVIEIVTPGTRVLTPFEDLTKAEVMAICPSPRAFPKTHSCISQRLTLHDGTCYGCVVRRLAAIASASPDVTYAANPLLDSSAKAGNLLSLLSFCIDFLDTPRTIPSYQKEMIFGFGKGDLFRRFALDNLAALHALKVKGKTLTPGVERAYEDALAVLDSDRPLAERLRTLKALKEAPPKLRFS